MVKRDFIPWPRPQASEYSSWNSSTGLPDPDMLCGLEGIRTQLQIILGWASQALCALEGFYSRFSCLLGEFRTFILSVHIKMVWRWFGDLIDCKPTWRINMIIYSFKSKKSGHILLFFLKFHL